MSLRIDLHVHTKLHSTCSQIDPAALVRQAVKAGLDGLVITEHQYQWDEADLRELVAASQTPHFLVLTGFEYWSGQGDILIYGLTQAQSREFAQGMPPNEAIRKAHAWGAVCIAAHPTRAGMGFDERIASLPFDAIEIRSCNLQAHEQRLAAQLASDLGFKAVAASDAHQLANVGRYATRFDTPIQTMADLQEALRNGTFHV